MCTEKRCSHCKEQTERQSQTVLRDIKSTRANKTGAEQRQALQTNRNQVALLLLVPVILILRGMKSSKLLYTCTYMPFPCVSESIAVLHYVSWPWCQRSSRVTLPVSINRWQHKIINDERIYLGLVFLDLVAQFFLNFHINIFIKGIYRPSVIICWLKIVIIFKLTGHA